MNRSGLADELLYQLAFETNTDIVLISEQYRNRDQLTWFSDPLSTSAIWISSSRNIRVEGHGSEEGFVWVRYEAMTFFSCYLTPNESIQQFRTKVGALEDAIFNTQGEVGKSFMYKLNKVGPNIGPSSTPYLISITGGFVLFHAVTCLLPHSLAASLSGLTELRKVTEGKEKSEERKLLLCVIITHIST
ncbi:hypothetical protein Trydic_g12556 [Trypoxylus dichotomus]